MSWNAKSSRRARMRRPRLGPCSTSAGLEPKKNGVVEMTRSPQMLKWSDR